MQAPETQVASLVAQQQYIVGGGHGREQTPLSFRCSVETHPGEWLAGIGSDPARAGGQPSPAVAVRREQMTQALRGQLNPLFKIHDLLLLEALPRTASGKVMRRVLRQRYQAERQG